MDGSSNAGSADDSAFRVAIKPSASDRNEAVARLVEASGDRLTFDSEAAARDRAGELTARGDGPVRIQAVAPQDGADVDAYLVGASRSTRITDGSPADGWRFGVDAAQYGALGEALLTAGDGPTTPLTCFVRHDLDLDPDADLSIDVDATPEPRTVPDVDGTWRPDCELTAAVAGRQVADYDCEIKTGAGTPERNQREIMEAVAAERPVVLARVDVAGLPQEFDVRFERIGSPDSARGQRTLDDWPSDE